MLPGYVLQVEFYLNNYTRSVEVTTALGRLSYGGYEANLAAALRLSRTRVFTTHHRARGVDDHQVARLAVVFTENRSTNLTATLAEATATREAGIGIITVGIGTAVDLYELSAVASYPHHRTSFHVNRLSRLSTVSDPIKRIICRGTYSQCLVRTVVDRVSGFGARHSAQN